MEGAGPCPDTLLILEVKGNSPITHLQKSSLEVKKGGSTTPKLVMAITHRLFG